MIKSKKKCFVVAQVTRWCKLLLLVSQDSTYVGKSFNVCPLEHICSSITTAKGYAELTGASGASCVKKSFP